jgi:hypothetical protein
MLYTPHFLTGAAIIKTVPNPVLGLPLALLSHVALDLLPHHDFEIKPGMGIKEIIGKNNRYRNFMLGAMGLDAILLSASFIWVYLMKGNRMMILGGLLAILPDLIEQGALLLGKKLPALQDRFQNRVCAKYGFISYPIVSLIALYILI